MKKSGRIAALFRCDGTKADGTLHTVAKATDGGAYAVVKTDGDKRTYAVVKGGTLIGDTLLGGELLTGFDFDSCRLDASGCLVLENGGDIASESNDGISVTYAVKAQQTQQQRLYDAASAHLAWTGLLYRGCCF